MSVPPDVMASRLALGAAKKELRNLMKKRLKEIVSAEISSQSSSATKRVLELRQYQTSKRVGIYLSMPSAEIQTDAIVRHAIESGKKVFVPYLYKHPNPPKDTPKSVMDMVNLHSLSDYSSLERDGWGIPTINAKTVEDRERILGDCAEEASDEGLDMILMPGVAFDTDPESGSVRRLGHGKGFYDYFMHRYLEKREGRDTVKVPEKDVLLYGLALEEQYLNDATGLSVPVGEWDHHLHGLIVGNGQAVEGPVEVKSAP